MYRKILVPTDGSDLARVALAEVGRLAGPESEVVLMQVVDTIGHIVAQTTPAGFDLAGSARYSLDAAEQIVQAQGEAAQRHLDEAKAALEQAGIANVSTRVLEGLPGPAIVEVAEQDGCDVIVMATHGRSGLMRTVMGSVADHVVRRTRGRPVLLVHPSESDADGAAADDGGS